MERTQSGPPLFFLSPNQTAGMKGSCVKGSEKNIFLQSQDLVAKETIGGNQQFVIFQLFLL